MTKLRWKCKVKLRDNLFVKHITRFFMARISIFKISSATITTIVLVLLSFYLSGCGTIIQQSKGLSTHQLFKLQKRARPAADLEISVVDINGQKIAAQKKMSPDKNLFIEVNMLKDGQSALSHTIIDVDLNHKRIKALVDSGSPYTLTTAKIADKTGITPIKNTSLNKRVAGYELYITPLKGLGGESAQILAMANNISLGDEVIKNIPVGIVNDQNGFGKMGWVGLQKVDMIIGNDFLSLFKRVVFDFNFNKLALDHRTDDYRPDPQLLIKSTALLQKGPVPIIAGSLAGKTLIPIVVDTGSDSGLWMPGSLAKKLNLKEFIPNSKEQAGRGFGGGTIFKTMAPRALEFDNFTIRNVPVSVETVPQTEKEMPFALLGQEVLRRFKITIDYEGERIYFER